MQLRGHVGSLVGRSSLAISRARVGQRRHVGNAAQVLDAHRRLLRLMKQQIEKPRARKPANCRRRRAGSGGTLRSGRDGDWVYDVVNGQQFRRRQVVPRDPRTPKQLRHRAALTSAFNPGAAAPGSPERSRRRIAPRPPRCKAVHGPASWVRSAATGVFSSGHWLSLAGADSRAALRRAGAWRNKTPQRWRSGWRPARRAFVAGALPPGHRRRQF